MANILANHLSGKKKISHRERDRCRALTTILNTPSCFNLVMCIIYGIDPMSSSLKLYSNYCRTNLRKHSQHTSLNVLSPNYLKLRTKKVHSIATFKSLVKRSNLSSFLHYTQLPLNELHVLLLVLRRYHVCTVCICQCLNTLPL